MQPLWADGTSGAALCGRARARGADASARRDADSGRRAGQALFALFSSFASLALRTCWPARAGCARRAALALWSRRTNRATLAGFALFARQALRSLRAGGTSRAAFALWPLRARRDRQSRARLPRLSYPPRLSYLSRLSYPPHLLRQPLPLRLSYP